MSKLLLFLLSALLLFLLSAGCLLSTDQIVLRTPNGGPSCQITNVSNASPAVVTCAAAHGWSAGQIIIVYNVLGNSRVNGVRTVKNDGNLTSTTFAMNDYYTAAQVNGSGTFSTNAQGATNPPNLAYAAPGTLYNLSDHPRLQLDGPSGTLSTALQNTGSGGRYQSCSVTRTAIDTIYTNNISTYNVFAPNTDYAWFSDGGMLGSLALHWWAAGANTGDTTGLNAAKYLALNPAFVFGGLPYCDETTGQCHPYQTISGQIDYASLDTLPYMLSYTLTYAQLTSGQRQTFANFFLNDNDESNMGLGIAGDPSTGCTKMSLSTGTGTITTTNGSQSVVGVGTAFTTQLSVGQYVVINPNTVQFQWAKITAIADDTHLTVDRYAGNFINFWAPSGSNFQYTNAWTEGSNDCGWVWVTKHHSASPFADPTTYPTVGGSTHELSNNGGWTKTSSYFFGGIALCGQDQRACVLGSQAHAFWYDQLFTYSVGSWGTRGATDVYARDREGWLAAQFDMVLRGSVPSYPDTRGKRILDIMPEFIYSCLPVACSGGQSDHYGGELTESYLNTFGGMASGLAGLQEYPSDAMSGYWVYWATHNFNWLTAASLGEGNGRFFPTYYIQYDPGISATNVSGLTTQFFSHPRDSALCSSFGLACSTNGLYFPRHMVWSRTGFSSTTDTLVQLNTRQAAADAHDSWGGLGNIHIWKKVPLMVGDNVNDNPGQVGSSYGPFDNVIEVGGESANQVGNFAGAPSNCAGGGINPITSTQIMTRWAGADPTGDSSSRYAYAMTNASNSFCSSLNVTRVNKHTVHFKKASNLDYVITYTDFAASSGVSVREFFHQNLNGCGNASSSSCISLNRAAGTISNLQTGDAVLNTQIVFPGPTGYVNTDNNSATDGSFTAWAGQPGFGKSFRVSVGGGSSLGTSVTAAEWIVVLQPSTTTTDTMPTVTQLSASDFRVIQVADSGSPKVAAFPQSGSTYTSASFTSTHSGTGQYLIAGLTAGTYDFKLNGSAVCSSVTVPANDNSLYCESGSGAITVVAAGAPAQGVTISGGVKLVGGAAIH